MRVLNFIVSYRKNVYAQIILPLGRLLGHQCSRTINSANSAQVFNL